ncbi:unnamed protein product [Caenorhabditis bovis]|uniref:Solute carrier family 3 member 2 N-terminal domain-containing protein n=1 Tax=Caenorhabditis bovis TaxID=2654633 RepID=A0A8S1EKU0_9PELO|nr:unnamed protein product [Caenorhabditis bovis]
MSSDSCSVCSDGSVRERKQGGKTEANIGYSLEELEKKRQEPFWRVIRVLSIVLFWGIWGGLLAGSVLIIVLNNGNYTPSTPTPSTTTIHPKQL